MATKQNHKPSHNNRSGNPFPQPWANAKHAYRQVNGETRQAQNMQIVEIQTRKRS
ncbi:MAG: YpzG family protein [Bacillaceae bacterium]|nr:YpzG family protein [Bacillaceae bacterium]